MLKVGKKPMTEQEARDMLGRLVARGLLLCPVEEYDAQSTIGIKLGKAENAAFLLRFQSYCKAPSRSAITQVQ